MVLIIDWSVRRLVHKQEWAIRERVICVHRTSWVGCSSMTTKSTKFEMIPVFHEMHIYETLSMKMKQLQTKSTCSSPWYAKLASSFTKINLIIAWNHSLSERGGVGTLCIQGAGQGSARSGDTMHSIFFVAQLKLLINNGLTFSCYLVASQSFADRSWPNILWIINWWIVGCGRCALWPRTHSRRRSHLVRATHSQQPFWSQCGLWITNTEGSLEN